MIADHHMTATTRLAASPATPILALDPCAVAFVSDTPRQVRVSPGGTAQCCSANGRCFHRPQLPANRGSESIADLSALLHALASPYTSVYNPEALADAVAFSEPQCAHFLVRARFGCIACLYS